MLSPPPTRPLPQRLDQLIQEQAEGLLTHLPLREVREHLQPKTVTLTRNTDTFTISTDTLTRIVMRNRSRQSTCEADFAGGALREST